jgi:malonyl CoA-acyl carrier protein transacylase
MVGDWLEILLCRKAPAGGAWLGHSLGVVAACAFLAVGASLMQIMHIREAPSH